MGRFLRIGNEEPPRSDIPSIGFRFRALRAAMPDGLPLLDKQGRFAQAARASARAETRAQIPDLP